MIFSLYFISWLYILIKSYYNYPVELIMFKRLMINFALQLCQMDDTFA
jgi:hypothetical protein